VIACAAGAAAAEPQAEAPSADAPAASGAAPASDSERSWVFEVTPYLFITGLHGDLGVTPAIPPVHVSLSPADIFSSLKFGIMGAVQARYDRFVALSDNIYSNNGFSKHITIRDRAFLSGSVNSKMFDEHGRVPLL
jgi:hypothetical protein